MGIVESGKQRVKEGERKKISDSLTLNRRPLEISSVVMA